MFQESAAKSDPTVATAKAQARGIARSEAAGRAQESDGRRLPATKQTAIRPRSERTFAEVKTFWRVATFRTLVVFHQVRKAIRAMATSSTGESRRNRAWKKTCFEETAGRRTPRYFAKATPTAASVPVWMTRSIAQP